MLPVFFEEELLGVAVAHAGGEIAGAQFLEFRRGGEQLAEGEDIAGIGILRLVDRGAVGNDLHHLLAHLFFRAKELDGVAIAFRHLLAIEAGDDSHILADHRFGNGEDLAIGVVEADGQVAGNLDVLLLVLADRHHVGTIDQDVGGHQCRIREQADIGGDATRHLVLVAVAAFEQSHRTEGVEDPGELLDLHDIGLAIEDGPFGIQAASQEIDGDATDPLTQFGRFRILGHRMVVGDEIQALGPMGFLELDCRLHHAEVVAQMQGSGWLHPGKHALDGHWSLSSLNYPMDLPKTL